MTHATKAIYRWLLADYIKVSNISAELMLYNETDLEQSMDKIETINFHEEKEVGGVRFWCYNAGHVLGAAMFMIEIAGVKVLYTGDFSRQEDRHLMSAEIPAIRPDILIIESTYGTHIHEKREEREARFTGVVSYLCLLWVGRKNCYLFWTSIGHYIPNCMTSPYTTLPLWPRNVCLYTRHTSML